MSRGARSTGRRTELASLLGVEPPAALDELSDDEMERLVAAISDARRRHHDDVARAEADVIRHVPLPFRGAVRRLMG